MKSASFLIFALVALLSVPSQAEDASSPLGLAEVAHSRFDLGATVKGSYFRASDENTELLGIVENHFNVITAENAMKKALLVREEAVYDFSVADRIVEYAEDRGIKVHGHTLVWHSSSPGWLTDGEKDRTRGEMIRILQSHIRTVVSRYRGRIESWDVVNEAVDDDGGFRSTIWYDTIGPEYLEIAFRAARESDPEAKLIYNDYLVVKPLKRAKILEIASDLKRKGLIDGIGIQGHWSLDYPALEDIAAMFADIRETGLKVYITEMDIDVLPTAWEFFGADVSRSFVMQEGLDPYTGGLPPEIEEQQATRYAGIFDLLVSQSDILERVTFWGITDRGSWLNSFPVKGRTNYPLLFDRENKPKKAFFSILEVLGSAP